MPFGLSRAASFSGGGTISGSLTINGDLTVNGDGSGNYDEIVDGNMRISSTNQLQFGDTGTYIYQSADGVLDLVSDTEIEINATTIDINGAIDVSGTATFGSTITAGSLGADTDNTVVVVNSSGLLKTDEIDSRVWGSTLVDTDASGANNELATWSDANTIIGEGNLTFDGTDLFIAGGGNAAFRDNGGEYIY